MSSQMVNVILSIVDMFHVAVGSTPVNVEVRLVFGLWFPSGTKGTVLSFAFLE